MNTVTPGDHVQCAFAIISCAERLHERDEAYLSEGRTQNLCGRGPLGKPTPCLPDFGPEAKPPPGRPLP
jgi:hypothetical protein